MQPRGCRLTQPNDCVWRWICGECDAGDRAPGRAGETWRWLTDPSELSRWLAPEVELEPWEGGAVETAGEPDPRTGVVERVDENELLRIRWWPLEDEDAATTVEFELGDDPAGTRVRVTETESVPASGSARPRALATA